MIAVAFWSTVLGLGASWGAAALFNAASTRLPVTLAGQLIVFETIFGVLYVFLAEGRHPAAIELAGFALSILGIGSRSACCSVAGPYESCVFPLPDAKLRNRSPTTQEETMTATDIRAFFDGYARAFTAQDAAAICDHYAFPVQILSEKTGYVFRNKTEMMADMTGFVAFYDKVDFARRRDREVRVPAAVTDPSARRISTGR